jgi:hypothetical protein
VDPSYITPIPAVNTTSNSNPTTIVVKNTTNPTPSPPTKTVTPV